MGKRIFDVRSYSFYSVKDLLDELSALIESGKIKKEDGIIFHNMDTKDLGIDGLCIDSVVENVVDFNIMRLPNDHVPYRKEDL